MPIQLVGTALRSMGWHFLRLPQPRLLECQRCKSVIAAKERFFYERNIWWLKFLFQAKIVISNHVNVLTTFSVHFTAHLMNTCIFQGKCQIVWVTQNFWLGWCLFFIAVYIFISRIQMSILEFIPVLFFWNTQHYCIMNVCCMWIYQL